METERHSIMWIVSNWCVQIVCGFFYSFYNKLMCVCAPDTKISMPSTVFEGMLEATGFGQSSTISFLVGFRVFLSLLVM